MQARFCLLFTILLGTCVRAQSSLLRGTVLLDGEPAVGATLLLEPGQRYAMADTAGRYGFTDLERADYQLSVSYVGAGTQTVALAIEEGANRADFDLRPTAARGQTVVVVGQSEGTRLGRLPLAVTSLDARSLRAQSIETVELLRQSTGVQVRRGGGLGSPVQISLGGLAGPAVRVYYDGLPLEYYGGALSLNNLPVNQIERIDLYRGVMPVRIGTDALAGGIDVVSRAGFGNGLAASYEIGSFHTHRLTLNGTRSTKRGFSIGLNAFANYSDNDYRMRDIPTQEVVVFDNDFGRRDTLVREGLTDARRFHDRHRSAFAEVQLNWTDRPWARRFSLATAVSARDDEVQHGRRVSKQPAGEAVRQRSGLIQRVSYVQDLGERVEIDFRGLLSYGRERVRDSTLAIYGWDGELLPISSGGGAEILPRPSGRRGRMLATANRFGLGYRPDGRSSLYLSTFLAGSRTRGEDPYGARIQLESGPLDPNAVPATFLKSITGLEAQRSWFGGRLTGLVFGKFYAYRAESIDVTIESADRVPVRPTDGSLPGGGAALKYGFRPGTFLRASYERAVRIPTEGELYGDFLIIVPNYDLGAERSHNINLGGHWRADYSGGRMLSVEGNTFWRAQRDLIRLAVFGGGERATYVNEARALSRGGELSVSGRPLPALTVTANLTYQRVTLAAAEDIRDRGFVGLQIPNIPDVLANAAVSYRREGVLHKADALDLFYRYHYVRRFSVTYVSDLDAANPDNVVPTQHQHDAGVSYRPRASGLQLALQVRNLLNERLFDNFRVPRPGTNVSLKISYDLPPSLTN
jgi:outer membrane receptor protein involved in Fe transport